LHPVLSDMRRESRVLMINDKFSDKEYWQGVLETCEYFRDELGFEDAMDTHMAVHAQEELALV
jgi:hypothetical protein